MITRPLIFTTALVLNLLFFSYSSHAQKPAIFSFELVDSITDYSSFNAVRIIDHRKDKSSIGNLRKSYGAPGIFTIETNPDIATSQPLPEAVSDYAAATIARARKGEDTLLLVLQDFQMEIEPVHREAALFHFRGLFFLGRNNSYRLLMDADTMISIKGMDVVHKVMETSNRIVFDYLKLAAGTATHALAGASYTADAAAYFMTVLKINTPVYNVRSFQPGVYETVDDFLNLTPSGAGFIQKDNFVEDRNRPFFYNKDAKGKKGEKITSAFAIYNGERWYKRHKGLWTQFTYRDGDFYLGKELHFNLLRKKYMPVTLPYAFQANFRY